MKKHYLFHLKPGSSYDDAWEELCILPLEDVYCLEDEKSITIGGWASALPNVTFRHISYLEEAPYSEVDWDAQWAHFSPGYANGKAQLDLKPYGVEGPPLYLLPGKGFGDLSHPTTRLMMQLLSSRAKGCHVLDIGCGSGILALASLRMGAASAYGLELDDDALEHAKENAKLNSLNSGFSKKLNDNYLFETPRLVLMNMIFTEQIQAWEDCINIQKLPKKIITSGILKSQRDMYLEQTLHWNWSLFEEKEEESWLGFVFFQN